MITHKQELGERFPKPLFLVFCGNIFLWVGDPESRHQAVAGGLAFDGQATLL